ncbi:hypothetical protein AVEN_166367-1 [Araneus ventricosus]|uniref:Uncharacterized protein n=1 Tax=Araneus ventricosus TaxID=182803 RepID=A0A4Y2NT26_ARAVE|nr:hypothetical protein AVEN_166367-1 [Araneus ventricosus]
MSSKGLNITKTLEIFRNSSSDEEFDESSPSKAEDFIDKHSFEDTDVDDGDIDISYPVPSRISKVFWRHKGLGKIRIMLYYFTKQSGPMEDIISLSGPSPISIFLTLFSVSFIESIGTRLIYRKLKKVLHLSL